MKSKLLGDIRLLDGLRNFDITTVKKEMSSKCKTGIKELKKMCGNVEGPEL